MGIVVTLSSSSTMSAFKLLASSFCLLSLALTCQGTLKEDFCTDVSFWDVIKYTSTTAKCCDTVLKEECRTQGKKCHVTYKDFPYKDCKEEKYSVQHHKEVPEYKTVTKDNCVTDWNIDEHGNKVWGGKEKCEPVSWEESRL